MASYRLRIKRSAAKELEAIPRKADRLRIAKKIQSLAEDPHPPGCRKLSGLERYRLRQGNTRIVYAIEDDALVVYVIRIADRKRAYDRL